MAEEAETREICFTTGLVEDLRKGVTKNSSGIGLFSVRLLTPKWSRAFRVGIDSSAQGGNEERMPSCERHARREVGWSF